MDIIKKIKNKNMENTFNQNDLLVAIDAILPHSKHYKRILEIHVNELDSCQNIIDLACGTGILVQKFLREGKCVTAVDASEESLNFLREKTKGFTGLNTLNCDVTQLGLIKDETFDGASSMIAAHLINNFRAHLSETFRILKPKGKFVITARRLGQEQERIVDIVKNSLLEQGCFYDFEKEFFILRDKLLLTAKDRSVSLLSVSEVKSILREIGFSKIKEFENESAGVMYTLSAEK